MLNPLPSTATKALILDLMFEECGRAGYEFDRTSSEDASALRRLDALMSEWQAQGIYLNYNFPAVLGQSQPTDAAGVPDAVVNTVALAGALRIAPGMGKTLSPETRKALADGIAFVRAETATIPSALFPRTTPSGLGNKPWSIWYPFEREASVSVDQTVLADLVISDATAPTGSTYAAVLSGYPQGVQLQLTNSVGGKYTLNGNLLQGVNLTAGTDAPIVTQVLPGATNSPYATAFAIVVS